MNQEHEGTKRGKDVSSTTPEAVQDSVCGMNVDPKSAGNRHKYGGETYYFCGEHWLSKFRSAPAKYAHS